MRKSRMWHRFGAYASDSLPWRMLNDRRRYDFPWKKSMCFCLHRRLLKPFKSLTFRRETFFMFINDQYILPNFQQYFIDRESHFFSFQWNQCWYYYYITTNNEWSWNSIWYSKTQGIYLQHWLICYFSNVKHRFILSQQLFFQTIATLLNWTCP